MGVLSKPSNDFLQQEDLKLEPTGLYIKADGEGEPSQRLYLPRTSTAPGTLDEYLSTIPGVVSRAEELMALCDDEDDNSTSGLASSPPIGFSRSTSARSMLRDRMRRLQRASISSRCLNVLQGEVAHASAEQADIVVSAEATTCHVVALRSTSDGDSSSGTAPPPLVSLAHVDQPDCYDKDLEAMLQEHLNHHEQGNEPSMLQQHMHHHHGQKHDPQQQEHFGSDDKYASFLHQEDDVKEGAAAVQNDDSSENGDIPTPLRRSSSSPNSPITDTKRPIQVELHMLGGFLDKDGRSQELSTSLLTTFSRLAKKYSNKMHISLSTAAISCLNSTAEEAGPTSSAAGAAPKSRGLGIDTRTGQVFPIKSSLPSHLEGPAVEVRSARAWHTAGQELSFIHDTTTGDGQVRVKPFSYRRNTQLDALLHVPDEVLLQHTSTSPEAESDRFCSDLRRAVKFVNSVPPQRVFGPNERQSLVYTRRHSKQNEWVVSS